MHRSVPAALALAAALLARGGFAGDTETVVTDFDDILASDPAQYGAHFGSSCALAEDLLFVGAPQFEHPGGSRGAVFQFRRGAHAWIPDGMIRVPPEHVGATGFGNSGSLAFEPPRLFVSAPSSDFAGPNRGACLVYEDLDGDGLFELEQTILSPLTHEGLFGTNIDVDGGRLLIGAPGNVFLPQPIGTAFVYVQQGGTWVVEGQLDPPAPPGPSAQYGRTVAIQGDEAFVRQPELDCVHVFQRSGGGWAWTQTIVSPVPMVAGEFGFDMCTHPGWIAIGGFDRAPDTGNVHLFERQGPAWIHQSTITSPDPSDDASFGINLDRSGDLLAVTDPGLEVLYLFQEHAQGWVPVGAEPSPFTAIHSGFPYGPAVDASSGFVVVGASLIADSQGRVVSYHVRNAVNPYCAGDGSAADCPCANQGAPAAGCANSTGVGGSLDAEGSTSVALDDLRFLARDLLPGQAALLFAGTHTVAGGAGLAFGDGLRCAGGDVVRLGVSTPNSNGHAFWNAGLAPLGGWQAGDARAFQAWYRDPVGGPCASGFNLTQGLRVEFVP